MQDTFLKTDIIEIAQRLGILSNDFSGKTILLTGGRGFLGRYFMEYFNYLNTKILDKDATKPKIRDSDLHLLKEIYSDDVQNLEKILYRKFYFKRQIYT